MLASSGDFELLLKKVSNPAKLKAVREVVAANSPPALPREPSTGHPPVRRPSRSSAGEADAGLGNTWSGGTPGATKEKKRLASTAPAAVLGLGKGSPSAVLAALDGRPPGSTSPGGAEREAAPVRGKRGPSTGRSRGSSSEGSRGLEAEVLDPVVGALDSKDWRERCTGLARLVDLLQERPVAAIEGSVVAIADALAPRMTDANSKVGWRECWISCVD